MRTVRSVARARNRPRGHVAWVVVGVVILLIALMSRAYADDLEGYDARDVPVDHRDPRHGGRYRLDAEPEDGPPGRGRLYIPITNAMVERVVTVAPAIGTVIEAAYRTAALSGDPTPGWRRRSRASALIPRLSARAGQNEAWRDVIDPTVSHSVVFDVRATWDFDRLLFDPNELRISAIAVARRRERRRLAAETIRLYYDWVAARAAADGDQRAILDAAEKTAELDALTDGWFSQALAKRAELR